MDSLYWWIGAIAVWLAGAWLGWMLLVEFGVVGLANALSFRRWRIRCLQVEKRHLPELKLWGPAHQLLWIWRLWVKFSGHRANSGSMWAWNGPWAYGEWRGIGCHKVVERTSQKASHDGGLIKESDE